MERIKISYVQHMPGHKNSKGEKAEYVIKDHNTNKILSSHSTEAAAKEHLKQMHAFSNYSTIEELLRYASSYTFLGACDRIRRTAEGENLWQEMMATREEVSEDEFLSNVNIDAILDEDETWETYKEEQEAQNSPITYFKSEATSTYFLITSGFEFVWKK